MNKRVPATLVTLRTSDGGSVPASKESRSACSLYFDALFNGPMSKPCRGDFQVPEVSMESMQAIVTHCSTGHGVITANNGQDLTVAVKQVLVDSRQGKCRASTLRNLDVDQSSMFLERSGVYYLESFKQSDFRFLLGNTELACKDNCGFIRLSLTNLADILLGSVELNVRQEGGACKAAVLWIRANFKERRQCLGTMLPKVRFGLVKRRYLKKVVMRSPSVNPPHKTIVQGCYDGKSGRDAYPRDPAQRMSVQRARADIRYKIYVTGTDPNTLSPSCHYFDPVAMTWSPAQPTTPARVLFHAAGISDSVYCTGCPPDSRITLDQGF
ncbi:kelch-like protein 10 [Haemaphysalis longicornis]